MSEDLPVLIEVIDREDRIRGALPIVDEMVTEGLVTLEDVDVLFYRANEKKA
jgi:PII-like signaling protein